MATFTPTLYVPECIMCHKMHNLMCFCAILNPLFATRLQK